MHFCESFHLPRPTPTLNLLIWRCHDAAAVPAETLQRPRQIEQSQSPATKRAGAGYYLRISSICTYPTALHFYFCILESVHRRKASYFDGEALGLRSYPQLQWPGKTAHLSRLCIVSYVWFGELNLNLITTHNVWKHSDLICLTLSHQTVYKEFIYFLGVYVNSLQPA